MKTITKYKKQSGFAMLEVVLAIVIIAIASFGVYKLYDASSASSKLSSEEDVISQIYNEATQLASMNGSQPTAEELFDSGAFSTDVYPKNDGVFPGAFGDITYTGHDTYASIKAINVPGSVAKKLASHMKDWGNVYYISSGGDSTEYTSSSTFSSSDLYTFTLYFPRGAYTG